MVVVVVVGICVLHKVNSLMSGICFISFFNTKKWEPIFYTKLIKWYLSMKTHLKAALSKSMCNRDACRLSGIWTLLLSMCKLRVRLKLAPGKGKGFPFPLPIHSCWSNHSHRAKGHGVTNQQSPQASGCGQSLPLCSWSLGLPSSLPTPTH